MTAVADGGGLFIYSMLVGLLQKASIFAPLLTQTYTVVLIIATVDINISKMDSENKLSGIGMRIEYLYKSLGFTQHGFSIHIGVSQTSLSNVTGGRGSKPSYEMLEKIANAVPEVSMEWLIRGQGNMLRSATAPDATAWELLHMEQQQRAHEQHRIEMLQQQLSTLKDMLMKSLK